jgi:cytochrome b561
MWAGGIVPRLALTPMELGASGQPAKPGGDLDFNLLGDEKPKERTPAEIRLEEQEKLRRTMLTTHQVVGLSTLGLLAVTVVFGQLNYNDRFSPSAANTAKYEYIHETLALATLLGFATTGALGLLAPKPDDRPRGFDTTAVHKICMAAAALGMMTELGLGFYTAGRTGYINQKELAQIHDVTGFSTLGFMTIGAGAFIF